MLNTLDETQPTPSSPRSNGDDEFRNLKKVLKEQFPGANGNGYGIAIEATENELNRLIDVRDSVQGQIDSMQTQIDNIFAALASAEFIMSAPLNTVFWVVDNAGATPAGWVNVSADYNYTPAAEYPNSGLYKKVSL